MLTVELINSNIPRLKLQDSAGKALQVNKRLPCNHLPVVQDEKYLGLVRKKTCWIWKMIGPPLKRCRKISLVPTAVTENEHFLNAVNCKPVRHHRGAGHQWRKRITGVITAPDPLKAFIINFAGTNEKSAEYGAWKWNAASLPFLKSAVLLKANATIFLHLNTTVHPETGMLTVTIHYTKKKLPPLPFLERYDYDVIYYLALRNFETRSIPLPPPDELPRYLV